MMKMLMIFLITINFMMKSSMATIQVLESGCLTANNMPCTQSFSATGTIGPQNWFVKAVHTRETQMSGGELGLSMLKIEFSCDLDQCTRDPSNANYDPDNDQVFTLEFDRSTISDYGGTLQPIQSWYNPVNDGKITEINFITDPSQNDLVNGLKIVLDNQKKFTYGINPSTQPAGTDYFEYPVGDNQLIVQMEVRDEANWPIQGFSFTVSECDCANDVTMETDWTSSLTNVIVLGETFEPLQFHVTIPQLESFNSPYMDQGRCGDFIVEEMEPTVSWLSATWDRQSFNFVITPLVNQLSETDLGTQTIVFYLQGEQTDSLSKARQLEFTISCSADGLVDIYLGGTSPRAATYNIDTLFSFFIPFDSFTTSTPACTYTPIYSYSTVNIPEGSYLAWIDKVTSTSSGASFDILLETNNPSGEIAMIKEEPYEVQFIIEINEVKGAVLQQGLIDYPVSISFITDDYCKVASFDIQETNPNLSYYLNVPQSQLIEGCYYSVYEDKGSCHIVPNFSLLDNDGNPSNIPLILSYHSNGRVQIDFSNIDESYLGTHSLQIQCTLPTFETYVDPGYTAFELFINCSADGVVDIVLDESTPRTLTINVDQHESYKIYFDSYTTSIPCIFSPSYSTSDIPETSDLTWITGVSTDEIGAHLGISLETDSDYQKIQWIKESPYEIQFTLQINEDKADVSHQGQADYPVIIDFSTDNYCSLAVISTDQALVSLSHDLELQFEENQTIDGFTVAVYKDKGVCYKQPVIQLLDDNGEPSDLPLILNYSEGTIEIDFSDLDESQLGLHKLQVNCYFPDEIYVEPASFELTLEITKPVDLPVSLLPGPYFTEDLQTEFILDVINTQTINFILPDIKDDDPDASIMIEIKLNQAKGFCQFNEATNTLLIPKRPLTEIDLGDFTIDITLIGISESDQQQRITEYTIKIQVIEEEEQQYLSGEDQEIKKEDQSSASSFSTSLQVKLTELFYENYQPEAKTVEMFASSPLVSSKGEVQIKFTLPLEMTLDLIDYLENQDNTLPEDQRLISLRVVPKDRIPNKLPSYVLENDQGEVFRFLDGEKSSQEFSYQFKDITETQFTIKVTFEHPLEVSSDSEFPDFLWIFINSQSVLYSKDGGSLEISDQPLVVQIPPQISKKAEVIIDQVADAAKSASGGVVGPNLVLNMLMSGSLNMLWGVFNGIQIMAHSNLYGLNFPANLSMVNEMFMSIIAFEIVNLDEFYNELNLTETDPFEVSFAMAGYETSSLLRCLGAPFFILVYQCLQIILMVILNRVLLCNQNTLLKRFTHALNQSIKWNPVIRFFLQEYLVLAICVAVNFIDPVTETAFDIIQMVIVVLFTITMLAFVVWSYKFMASSEPVDLFHDKQVMKTYGSLYDNLKPMQTKGSWALSPFIFLLRRIVLVFVLITLNHYPTHQIQVVMQMQIFVLMYVVYVNPLAYDLRNMEIFSELTILVMGYLQFLLTDFIQDPQLRTQIGWWFIGMWISYFLINLIKILVTTLVNLYRSTKRWYYIRKTRDISKLQSKRFLSRSKSFNQQRQQQRRPRNRVSRINKKEIFDQVKKLNILVDSQDQTSLNINQGVDKPFSLATLFKEDTETEEIKISPRSRVLTENNKDTDDGISQDPLQLGEGINSEDWQLDNFKSYLAKAKEDGSISIEYNESSQTEEEKNVMNSSFMDNLELDLDQKYMRKTQQEITGKRNQKFSFANISVQIAQKAFNKTAFPIKTGKSPNKQQQQSKAKSVFSKARSKKQGAKQMSVLQQMAESQVFDGSKKKKNQIKPEKLMAKRMEETYLNKTLNNFFKDAKE